MSIIDTIRRALGLDGPKPQPPQPVPPADDILPMPRPGPAPRPAPAGPVATLTLGKDQASVSSPQGGQSRQGSYRRPARVASGSYTARREGTGVGLYQGSSRVSTVYPYEQAGVNDLGLQMLTWQMLLNAVESQNDATVRIDDQHPGDERSERSEGPDVDLDGLGDIDLSGQTQREQDAVTALGVLGFDTVGPAEAKPVPPEQPRAEPPPVESATQPAPEPAPIVAPPTVDSWAPSGAYER